METGEAARWRYLGVVSYESALAEQRRIARERALGSRPDTLLLLEHPAVVTLGRRAGDDDLGPGREWLRDRRIDVVRTDRGGRATYHGPGQLVGYPIVRLGRAGRGVREFVMGLERVLADAIARFAPGATTRRGHPGVWVGSGKIASIGIAVRRGITMHGFALNVQMDLAPFAAFVPCGVPGLEMTDLSRHAGRTVSVEDAVRAVVTAWRRRFGRIEEEADGDPGREET